MGGASLSSREQQSGTRAHPALQAYRDEALAYLRTAGVPVLSSSLGHYVRRPMALSAGPGKMAVLAIFKGDARFRVEGGQGVETVCLA